uniref:RanBP2-type domain-containing protein n=1 Tax=Steinernema glaseri TaxID=37863 RepID=A0A1I7XVJ3_9BILA
MARTDASRFMADLQEMHERRNRHLMQMMADLSDQVRDTRVSQERLRQELTMLRSSVNTTAVLEESKLWRQWAQATIAQTNNQKEQMDRMLTMFGMMGMQGAPIPLPIPPPFVPLFKEEKPEGFGDASKPKLGLWECKGCFATIPSMCNNAKVTTCPRCGANKDRMETMRTFMNLPTAPSSAFSPPFAQPSVVPPATTTAPRPTAPKEEPQGFGDAWKPKPGSWECKGCYIRNNDEVALCPSCGTNKDGTTEQPPTESYSFQPLDAEEQRRIAGLLSVDVPPSAYNGTPKASFTDRTVPRGVGQAAADGNCGFRSLAQCIFGAGADERIHLRLRHFICDFIAEQIANARQPYWIVAHSPFEVPLHVHLENMREAGTWMSDLELQAAALALKINIFVFTSQWTPFYHSGSGAAQCLIKLADAHFEPVFSF